MFKFWSFEVLEDRNIQLRQSNVEATNRCWSNKPMSKQQIRCRSNKSDVEATNPCRRNKLMSKQQTFWTSTKYKFQDKWLNKSVNITSMVFAFIVTSATLGMWMFCVRAQCLIVRKGILLSANTLWVLNDANFSTVHINIWPREENWKWC